MSTVEVGRRVCQDCGRSCVTDSGLCMACETALQAAEPPQLLRDFRWVYEEQVPVTPSQFRAKQLYDLKPDAFLNRLERMEREWRKGPEKEERKPEEFLEDAGFDRVVESIESLLMYGNEYSRVGMAVAEAWGRLSAEQRAVIGAMVPGVRS